MKGGLWAVGAVIVALLAAGVLLVGTFALQWFTAEPRGALEAREEVVGSGEFRLAAYNHFFDLCSSIEGMEGQLAALEDELKDPAIPPDRQTQVRASITGLTGQRARSIARYNADAHKDYTVGQFRDAGLPFQLDVREETRCA